MILYSNFLLLGWDLEGFFQSKFRAKAVSPVPFSSWHFYLLD